MTWDYKKSENDFSTKSQHSIKNVDLMVYVESRAGITIEMLGMEGEKLNKLRRVRDDLDFVIQNL